MKKERLHPLFDIRRLPMDLARLVCAVLIPILRVKKITPEGEKCKARLKGGAIIAANHTSFADPFIAGVTFWYRRVFFLVAEVVLKNPVAAFFLKGVGTVKIDRNATDIEAITRSVTLLKKGYTLLVFPQGGITGNDSVDALKSGSVLMAIRAGVPIQPIHIEPRAHWYNRRTVVIGNLIDPKSFTAKKMPSTADIANITAALSDEMNRCKEANKQKEN